MKRRSFFARVFGLAAASAVAPEVVKAAPVKRPGWTLAPSRPEVGYYVFTNTSEVFQDFEMVGYAEDGGIIELKPQECATTPDES